MRIKNFTGLTIYHMISVISYSTIDSEKEVIMITVAKILNHKNVIESGINWRQCVFKVTIL